MYHQKKARFMGAHLAESVAEIPNPGRGWYQVYSFDVREAIDEEELKWCLDVREHLVLITLDIGCCRDRDLTDAELINIRRIFDFFASHGKQMIVRTVYDREGKGPEREPETFSLVLQHIRRLGPLFAKYAAYILTLQGLLVGSWGEMHDSRYLSDEKLCELAKTMWEATGGSCCLSVRRPVQLRILRSLQAGKAWRIGLFDDGLFASESHLGTFAEGEYGARNAVDDQGCLIDDQPWPSEKELDYLNRECVRVPNGGESPGNELSQDKVLDTMQRMHLTYLNRVYSEDVISDWKQKPYSGEDRVYQDCSLYDYIGLHLGYRFVIREAAAEFNRKTVSAGELRSADGLKGQIGKLFLSFGKGKREDGEFTMSLMLRGCNVGFGNLHAPAYLTLIARGSDGSEVRKRVEADPREWDAGKEFCIAVEWPGTIVADTDGMPWREELFLRLIQNDGEAIWFANRNAKNMLPIGTVFRWKPL